MCHSDHLVNCIIIHSNCYSLRRGEKGKSEWTSTAAAAVIIVMLERVNEQVYIWTWDSFGHRSQVQVCFVSSSCLLHFYLAVVAPFIAATGGRCTLANLTLWAVSQSQVRDEALFSLSHSLRLISVCICLIHFAYSPLPYKGDSERRETKRGGKRWKYCIQVQVLFVRGILLSHSFSPYLRLDSR